MVAVVELKNLSVYADQDENSSRTLLQKINVKVMQGEWVTILGLNGSGKSTLAKALAGLRLPSVAGEMARAFTPMPVPMVLQQPEAALLGATPWEDVVLMMEQYGGNQRLSIEKAEQALAQVGLAACMHQSTATLSGGQKQLTAIAGCMAVQAPMLVLDEVTAMLHPEAAAAVLAAVRNLHRQGTTVVWITQNTEELSSEDRLLAVEQGSIVYDGDIQNFFSRKVKKDSRIESESGDQENGVNNYNPNRREWNGSGAAFEQYDGMSICEQLGLKPPYSVQVAWELEALGLELPCLPVTPEELAAAAESLIRTGGSPDER